MNESFQWNDLYVSVERRNPSSGFVLFVHGGPGGNSALFQEVTRRLPVYRDSDYGWIFYDQRGCGRSKPAAANDLSHERNLVDLKELYTFLVEERKLPVRAIVGHSYGAWLTYDLALKDKLQQPKLVLLGFGEDMRGPRNRSLLMDLILLKMHAPDRYQQVFRTLLESDKPTWKMAKQVRQTLGDAQGRKHFYWANLDAMTWCEDIRREIGIPDNDEVFAAVRRTLYQEEGKLEGPYFRNLKAEYLWVVGFHDFLMAGECCEVSGANVFPASGHYPHIEEPDRFNHLMEKFLGI